MKKHKFKIIAAFLLLMLGLVLGIREAHRSLAARNWVNSTTPTFFFHGGGSNYHAEEYMTHSAKNAGITNTIVLANVDKQGHVTFHGNIKPHSLNPIIEVNYEANNVWGHKDSWKINGDYAYNVVSAATKKWHFKRMNLVGHSMGNMSTIYLIRDHQHDKNMPKLNKQVAMAGHFNGGVGFGYPEGSTVAKDGKPSQEEASFTEMKTLKKTYPKGAKVLNIYGDKEDGSHSDGDVPVNSARSLKYLVLPNAASYQEKEFKGKNASHSKLHHSTAVNKVLFKFLWGK